MSTDRDIAATEEADAMADTGELPAAEAGPSADGTDAAGAGAGAEMAGEAAGADGTAETDGTEADAGGAVDADGKAAEGGAEVSEAAAELAAQRELRERIERRKAEKGGPITAGAKLSGQAADLLAA
ncbi:DNA helicase RecD, partial [Streptomyces sp. SID4917]